MLRSIGLSLLIGCAVACGSSSSEDDTTAAEANLNASRLSDPTSSKLPLKEVSGLGVRKIDGKQNYLAIGDSTPMLITFDLDESGKVKSPKKNSLSGLFGSGPSQFEAVAGDGSGKVFILNEGESKISVITKDFGRITHTFKLTMPEDHDLASSWDRDENSRGEGMLLLKNGHILIAKEKGPPCIMEFATKRSRAAGYKPELALGDREFDVPNGDETELVPVAYWELKSDAARIIGDISDLALDSQGRILVLTDQGRAIVRVEAELTPDENKIDAKQVYELPRAVDKPEGLIVANGKPIVAIDNQDDSIDSVFSFTALPADR
jgi:uncharacterized protein YjiK